jgi:AraC family transcriptional regulator
MISSACAPTDCSLAAGAGTRNSVPALTPPRRRIARREAEATMDGACGARLVDYFRVEHAPALTVHTRRRSTITVTRLRSAAAGKDFSARFPPEDAFIILLQLQPPVIDRLRERRGEVTLAPCERNSVSIVHLKREPVWFLRPPFDMLHFYLPRTALDEIAEEHRTAPIQTLHCPKGRVDPVAGQLGACLLPALEGRDQPGASFIYHVILALLAHIAQACGGMRAEPEPVRGGLTPRQERRAKEILLSQLQRGGSVADVARECGLSPSHFSHSFKNTVGDSPHHWLTKQRIERVKRFLAESDLGVAEIAAICGYADQAYLTRVFAQMVGITPGAWRRATR